MQDSALASHLYGGDVDFKFFIVLIVWHVLLAGTCLAASIEGINESITDEKVKTMITSEFLSQKVELLTLPLDEQQYRLTYEMSDMDVASDRVPNPIHYAPDFGLYLVDPGATQAQEPVLDHYTPKGQRLYRISLVSKLKLQDPAAFFAHSLAVDNQGGVILLFSTSYNAQLNQQENFKLALVSRQGTLGGIVELPEVSVGHPILIGDNYLWVYRRKKPGSTWSVYNQKGILEVQIKDSRNAVLLPNDNLLVLSENGQAVIWDKEGRTRTLTLKGTFKYGDVMVYGNGNFFGMLNYPDPAWQHNKQGGLLQAMAIQLFYIDTVSSTLHALPSQAISPNHFDAEEIPKYFEYYDPTNMSIDSNGNLYLIARYGPGNPCFKVFKMGMNPDVRQQLQRSRVEMRRTQP